MPNRLLSIDQLNLKNIRWIAFDAVGTLIEPDPPVAEAYHHAAVRFGSALTIEEITKRFRTAFANSEEEVGISLDDWNRSDRLQTSEESEYQRWRQIVGDVIDDIDESTACFDYLFKHFAKPSSWRCYPEIADTLQTLSQAGYRLAMASNFDRRLIAIREALPQLQLVEACVVSSLIGYCKPSRLFFDHLLQTINASADEVLMVGDDPINDIEGARAAGLAVVEVARDCQNRPNSINSLAGLVELLCS